MARAGRAASRAALVAAARGLKSNVVDPLTVMRRPGESYSDVILRLVEMEAGDVRRPPCSSRDFDPCLAASQDEARALNLPTKPRYTVPATLTTSPRPRGL